MGSISLCICPPWLQCPCGNVHRARHSQNQSSPKEVQMRTQKVAISIWHSDVPCLYCPTHTENKEILCTRAAVQAKVQWLSGPHKCSTFMCHTLCIAVTASCYHHIFLIPNSCATGMEGNTFPLCRRTALRLTLGESINSLHSSEQWLMFNALNKPSTSLHATRLPSTVKNSSRFFCYKDTELFSHFNPNMSIVSFWMLADRPLTLAAPNHILDHSVSFV